MGRATDKRKSEEVSGRKVMQRQVAQTERQQLRSLAKAADNGEIPLSRLSRDLGTQIRAVRNDGTVEAYADAMQEGEKFPPIEVFYDGENYLLVDGFHRVAAAQSIGRLTLPANIRAGSLREAILYSIGANAKHGLPRTDSDKRRAVTRLLEDSEWGQWSIREIAKRAGVSRKLVTAVKTSLAQGTSDSAPSTVVYTNKHGQQATMNVRNIGSSGRTNVLSQPVVRPSLPADMAPQLVEAVDVGRLAPITALKLGNIIARYPQPLKDLALQMPIDSEARLSLLHDLYHSRETARQGAFAQIVETGGFEHDGQQIDFCAAPIQQVQDALKAALRQHAALQQEQARRAASETPPPSGKYKCIVIDPPWPMEKTVREARPNQGQYLDYPTMSLDEIEALAIADLADLDGCHLYLWCPQRFVPDALNLVGCWGFGYRNIMTWVKPTGMPVWNSWQYNTEHVIFAQRGSIAMLKVGEQLSFDAPSIGHSIKPTVFYERVARVSPGPRLDMFARQQREGFIPWGFEAPADAEREVAHAAL